MVRGRNYHTVNLWEHSECVLLPSVDRCNGRLARSFFSLFLLRALLPAAEQGRKWRIRANGNDKRQWEHGRGEVGPERWREIAGQSHQTDGKSILTSRSWRHTPSHRTYNSRIAIKTSNADSRWRLARIIIWGLILHSNRLRRNMSSPLSGMTRDHQPYRCRGHLTNLRVNFVLPYLYR